MHKLIPFIAASLFITVGVKAQTKTKQPNILVFITDDKYKHMYNCLPEGKGKNYTPHTDQLASESTIMMSQYVTSPVCTPSRFGVMTGLYPSRSNASKFTTRTRQLGGQRSVEWNTFTTDEAHTLPKAFKKAGYRTGMVGKNHVIEVLDLEKPEWNANPTEKETVALLQRNKQRQKEAVNAAGFDYAESLYYDNPDFIGVKALASHNLDWIAKGALDFLKQPNDKPFFLYCAVTIPHGPGEPTRSWKADPRITADGMLKQPLNVLPKRDTILSRMKAAGIRDRSRANLTWLDDMVGVMVQQLKDSGEYDNTIILYFNDHGQKSKGTIYQGGVHTEAFIRKPGGFESGATLDAKASNLDFTPTLLDLAQIPYDAKNYDGKSLVPVLKKQTEEIHESLFFELGFVRGVIKGDYKYIALRYPETALKWPLKRRQRTLEAFNATQTRRGRPVYTTDPKAKYSHVSLIPGGGDAEHKSMGKYPAFYDPDQLYNLKSDPNEQVNLASSVKHQKVFAELKAELKAHLEKMPGTFGDLKPAKP